jgi:hypothetical protein
MDGINALEAIGFRSGPPQAGNTTGACKNAALPKLVCYFPQRLTVQTARMVSYVDPLAAQPGWKAELLDEMTDAESGVIVESIHVFGGEQPLWQRR